MTIRTIVTAGYGSFGSVPEIVTRGYLFQEVAADARGGGGGRARRVRSAADDRRIRKLRDRVHRRRRVIWERPPPDEMVPEKVAEQPRETAARQRRAYIDREVRKFDATGTEVAQARIDLERERLADLEKRQAKRARIAGLAKERREAQERVAAEIKAIYDQEEEQAVALLLLQAA